MRDKFRARPGTHVRLPAKTIPSAYGRDISARRQPGKRQQEPVEADAERCVADALARQAQAERDRLRVLFEQAPSLIAVLRSPEHVFELANAAYHKLFGGRDLVGKTVRDALPELAEQGFFQQLDKLFASDKESCRNRSVILDSNDSTTYSLVLVNCS